MVMSSAGGATPKHGFWVQLFGDGSCMIYLAGAAGSLIADRQVDTLVDV
jgi:hypothetical protein